MSEKAIVPETCNLFVSYVIQYAYNKKSNILTKELSEEVEKDFLFFNEVIADVPKAINLNVLRQIEAQLQKVFVKQQAEVNQIIILSHCKILNYQIV